MYLLTWLKEIATSRPAVGELFDIGILYTYSLGEIELKKMISLLALFCISFMQTKN